MKKALSSHEEDQVRSRAITKSVADSQALYRANVTHDLNSDALLVDRRHDAEHSK